MAPLLALAALAAGPACRAAWDPVDPADLAATASSAEAGADSEYLFWRSSLVDDDEGVSFRYQVRAKIYTARGVENAGKLHIDRPWSTKLARLTARVVKPDGTSVELQKGDFLESDLAKQGNVRWRRTSFAFPGLAPGDVVEYRWRVETDYGNPTGWYFCQQTVPVREYTMEIAAQFAGINVSWFNVDKVEQKKSGDSRLKLTIRNLPAFVEEPHMPPELDVRGWIRLTYMGDEKDPVKAWEAFTGDAGDYFEKNTKVNDALRKKAGELVAGAADDEEKIRRLHDFCRDRIVNLTWSDDPVAREERQRKTPRDFQAAKETLARGRGWPNEIDYLFAALLRAAGFTPHRTLSAPRYLLLNTRIPQGWHFMSDLNIAVQRGETWRFYSPGEIFVPYGMTDRFDEGAAGVIIAGKKSLSVNLPVSPDALSQRQRKARLALDAEGNLAGDIEIAYTGHEAVTERRTSWDKSNADLEKELTDDLRERIAGAEVSDVRWENLRAGTGPVVLRYKVSVPGYAEAAGQRLVVAPGFFTRGRKPVFTAPERATRLMWSNAWQDHDDVEIALPAGFALEQATSPAPVVEDGGLVVAKYSVGYSKRRHTLVYKRDFSFTANSGLVFPKETYPAFKKIFEDVNRSDTHAIVLRPAAAEAAPAAPAATPAAPAGQ